MESRGQVCYPDLKSIRRKEEEFAFCTAMIIALDSMGKSIQEDKKEATENQNMLG
jgi:hypothetical protein